MYVLYVVALFSICVSKKRVDAWSLWGKRVGKKTALGSLSASTLIPYRKIYLQIQPATRVSVFRRWHFFISCFVVSESSSGEYSILIRINVCFINRQKKQLHSVTLSVIVETGFGSESTAAFGSPWCFFSTCVFFPLVFFPLGVFSPWCFFPLGVFFPACFFSGSLKSSMQPANFGHFCW